MLVFGGRGRTRRRPYLMLGRRRLGVLMLRTRKSKSRRILTIILSIIYILLPSRERDRYTTEDKKASSTTQLTDSAPLPLHSACARRDNTKTVGQNSRPK